jgi:broad specificity phosphatase PhoE
VAWTAATAVTPQQAAQTTAQNNASRNRKPVIEDNDLRNQQLGDRGRKRKKRAPSVLSDAFASYATAIQTLLGA